MFDDIENSIYDMLMQDSSVTDNITLKQQIILILKSSDEDLTGLDYDLIKNNIDAFNKIVHWYIENILSMARDRNIEILKSLHRVDEIYHNIKYAILQVDKIGIDDDSDDMTLLDSMIQIDSKVTIDSTFKGLTIKTEESVLDVGEHHIIISLNMKQLTSLYEYSSVVFLKVNSTGQVFKCFVDSLDIKNKSVKLVNIHKYKYHNRKYFRIEEHNLKIKINNHKAISVDLSVDGIGIVTKNIDYRVGDYIDIAIDDPKVNFNDKGVIKNVRVLKDKYVFLGIDLMLSERNAELLKEFVFNYKQIQIIKEFKDKYSELERELT